MNGADALTVGIGSVVECRVDLCDGDALCVGRELLLGCGVVLAETLTLGERVPSAVRDDDDELATIGKMISAPTMKNTAAIATLDSGIASSGGVMIYAGILPITHAPRARNRPTRPSCVPSAPEQSMMKAWTTAFPPAGCS
ncbi:hypothetical protein GCM10023196_078750 [Actinoallomurus vinaceus]|uniref:Uncharacterized protein n=1 Tax=Actinoallomurus vinaceus TaxID=1080074 RepID=A0ABP8UR07_9ACTN